MSDDCSHTLLVHTQVLEERNAARRDAKIAEDEEAKKTAMAADKGSELLELASQHERTMGERNAACIDAVAARSELDGLWRELAEARVDVEGWKKANLDMSRQKQQAEQREREATSNLEEKLR